MNIKIQDGTIIREKNSGKMFLMSHGRRRWILTIEAAEQFNLDLSQYEEYSDEELKQIPIGGGLLFNIQKVWNYARQRWKQGLI